MSEGRVLMGKDDIMGRIARANRPVTTGVEDDMVAFWVTISVMGENHRVPADLTIMQAMEYAGYRFVRSAGCRAGFCGACTTIYRVKNDYKLRTAMACQTRVEDGMYLVQIPFSPAEKPAYAIEKEKYDASVFLKYYPEIARCVSCNTCTRACPQDLRVMDYVQAALRGDYEKVSEYSFDCIQCGLCALRCPAEIVQYNVAQLGRRMYGRYGLPPDPNLDRKMKDIARDEFKAELHGTAELGMDELRSRYAELQKTREVY
jgi:formate hydrogenlyase subunit 6/NADH:ubiquinone oxidoreductase subunit I